MNVLCQDDNKKNNATCPFMSATLNMDSFNCVMESFNAFNLSHTEQSLSNASYMHTF